MNLLSQNVNIGGQQITGPLVEINTVGDLVNRMILFLFPLAGIVLFFVLIWGGYDFLLSQGNPERIKSARAKITAGLIGFVLLVASYLIVKLITVIFGLQSGIL